MNRSEEATTINLGRFALLDCVFGSSETHNE
jgi:hypothetical protein